MTTLDWPGLMRAGLRGTGLTPAAFWALTPAELMLMVGADQAQAPLARAGLQALLSAFPDDKETPDAG